MPAVTVDVAGGPGGGAGRFRTELYDYLARSGRDDIQVIGDRRRLSPRWLLHRELTSRGRTRQVALNNVGFVGPGGERWTLLGNALHFLTEREQASLGRSLRSVTELQAPVVRMAARRSDVLVAPCSAMAERVCAVLPHVAGRVRTRLHPVSQRPAPAGPREGPPVILCPVLFSPYKHMRQRVAEWAAAADLPAAPQVRLLVTADPGELPPELAGHPRIEPVGRISEARLQRLWQCSQAVFFPPGLESFGFPLAEARANGLPVIARDTAQNREIAGPALCGYTAGDAATLRDALDQALTMELTPDPDPFDPDSYFDWMLGSDA
jgi:hypothetical protein